MLNNRHWALLLWLAVLSIWVMTKPDIRKSIGRVARSLFSKKLLPIWVGYLGWVLLLILGARRIGLWDSSLLPDTFIWLFVAGWGLFGSFAKADSEPEFFRTHLAQIIGISLLAEFVVDLAVLPLIWELLLVPLVVVLTGVEIVARRNEDGASVSRFASGCLVFIGFALLAAGLVSVVVNWDSLDVSALLRQLALPIWLSVLVLPYVYLIGIYAAYETVFTLLDIRHRPGWWRRQVTRLALITTFWTRVYDLGQLGRRCYFDLAHSQSWGEARAVIKSQLEDDANELRVDEAMRDLADRHAGRTGPMQKGADSITVSSKKLKPLCDTCTPATADGGENKSGITPIFSHLSVAPTACTAWIVQMATTSGCPRTGRAGLHGGRRSVVGSLESAPTRRHPTSGNMTVLILQQAHPELIHGGGTTHSGWRLVRIGRSQPLT